MERCTRNKRPARYDDADEALVVPTKKVRQLQKKETRIDPALKMKKKEYSAIISSETSATLLQIISEPVSKY